MEAILTILGIVVSIFVLYTLGKADLDFDGREEERS